MISHKSAAGVDERAHRANDTLHHGTALYRSDVDARSHSAAQAHNR